MHDAVYDRVYIWRSVRSTLPISSKNLRIWNWSKSGKNGSKHPILSISIAENVISYKKRKAKKNRWFYNVNSSPELRNDQNRQKKMDHSIAIYSIFCIGMVYFGCLHVNPHIQAVQNMCEKKEISINNWMYLQFTEQYRMAKGLC